MRTKVILLCGNHIRHLYLAKKLYDNDRLAALVIQEREEFIPQPPAYLGERDKKNFILHFERRDEAEKKYFGDTGTSIEEVTAELPCLRVTKDSLNSQKTLDFINAAPAEVLLTWGVSKVSDELIACKGKNSFNLHGGLAPYYRGSYTFFWTFYELRPNWAAATIHRLSSSMDGGEILHQSTPVLEHGDKMHEVACKTLIQGMEDFCRILEYMDRMGSCECVPQKNNGKLYFARDWNPLMLRMIYEMFEDKIVDMYLDGKIQCPEPPIIDFFARTQKDDGSVTQ